MDAHIARLREAKKKLEAAEKEKIVLDTKLEGLLDRLRDLGFRSVEATVEAVEKMESEINKLEDTLGALIDDFETEYSTLMGSESE